MTYYVTGTFGEVSTLVSITHSTVDDRSRNGDQ